MRTLSIGLGLAAICLEAQTLKIPSSAVDVRAEPGFVFTTDAARHGDLVTVFNEEGKTVLGPVFPAPESMKVRRVIVGGLTKWDETHIAVSVWYKQTLDMDVYGVALLDLRHGGRQPEFNSTGSYWCESISRAAGGGFWCAGRDMERLTRETPILRRYSDAFQVSEEQIPRSHFPLYLSRMRTYPGTGGTLWLWLPHDRIYCEVRSAKPANCQRDLPLETEGRALASVSSTPDGSLWALLPAEEGTESFLTPYAFYRLDGPGEWRQIPSVKRLLRGTLLVGMGRGGAAVWDRSARTLTYVPLPRVVD